MDKRQFDIIIIGQGLAGSILAYTLINKGQRVLVIDNNHHNGSSMVAAGIINPVTGHRLNITDGFEMYFPAAEQFYTSLQNKLNTSLYRPVSQQRLIKNKGQLNYFHQRKQEAAYRSVLSPTLRHSEFFRSHDFGVAEIHKTAIIDTQQLLTSIKQWLTTHQAYRDDYIDYQNITFTDKAVSVNDINASRLIFCEGYQAIHNPWLSHLPFKVSKGEILTLTPDTQINTLLNWGHWLTPHVSKPTIKIGSNFVWNDLSLHPNSDTATQFIDHLQSNTTISADILRHDVGIRPTTTHRRPFIGKLSIHPNTFCFNGFGSKGCLLIPYYAELLSNHLIQRKPLPNSITKWL